MAGKRWTEQQLWVVAWCEMHLSDIQAQRGLPSDAAILIAQLAHLLQVVAGYDRPTPTS